MFNKFLIIALLLFLVGLTEAQQRRPLYAPQRRPAVAPRRPARAPAVAAAAAAAAKKRVSAGSTPQNVNLTRLSIVVSGLEGTTEGTGTLLRPQNVPQVYAVAGKTRQFRVPFLISVNSIFIRSLRDDDERRRCLKRNQAARAKHQINPECQTVMRLNIPLDLIIPTNVESTAIEHDSNPDILDPLSVINYGPNGAMTPELYYAAGDRTRARRVKRTPQIRFKRSNPLFAD